MTKRIPLFFFFGVFAFGITLCSSVNLNLYSQSLAVSPDYTIYWRVDLSNQVIFLVLEANTTGWVGFGIGEPTSGGMKGSDIVTAHVTPEGQASITDRYALLEELPNEDSCQSWTLLSAQRTNAGMSVEISRALDTKDSQDRIIPPGSVRIVWAWGTSDNVTYHDGNRGASSILFYGSLPIVSVEPVVQTAEYFMPNASIPAQRTTYMCSTFVLPDVDAHIIQIDPIIQPETTQYVHHMLVYLCSNTSWFQSYFGKTSQCTSPVGNFITGCESVLFAWARGMGSMILPPQAGFRIGPTAAHPIQYVAIEIHYDNPNGDIGRVDSSGFEIHYTPQLRPNDAGILVLGDPIVNGVYIPPGLSSVERQYECTTACTSIFAHSITVFSDFSHMHSIGKQIWTSHWRGEEYLGEINRVDFYDFGFQQGTTVNVVINPGDRLNTHCIYDSTPRSDVTLFGLSSDQEMCMDYLSYYPVLQDLPSDGLGSSHFSFCGYGNNEWRWGYETNYTICGDVFVGGILENNPVDVDPPGGATRLFGQPSFCSISSDATLSLPTTFLSVFVTLFIILGCQIS